MLSDFKMKYAMLAMPYGTQWMNAYNYCIAEIKSLKVKEYRLPKFEYCVKIMADIAQAARKVQNTGCTYEQFMAEYKGTIPTHTEGFIAMYCIKYEHSPDIWMNELQTHINAILNKD